MNYLSLIALLFTMALLGGCGRTGPSNDEHGHEATEAAPAKGPRGGRMLVNEDFAIELVIYEAGVPPEYRAWATDGGRPIAPQDVKLAVELTRLGGEVDRIQFSPSGDYLRGDQEIVEPHSFAVTVTALHAGQTHRWSYESYEGRVSIPAAIAEEAGIETAVAGPGVIEQQLELYGSIVPDTAQVREVKARFPGVIRSVVKQVGETVSAGDVLATVESNESLQVYPVTSPLSGVITQRHAQTGEQADSNALFEVINLSKVWAEFKVFARDRSQIKPGQIARVLAEGAAEAQGEVIYVSPLSSRESQAVIARVSLDNRQGQWTPGQFVTAQLAVAQLPVELLVPLSALQTFRDFTVVFAQVGDTYEVRMLELGRRDSERVEVLGGLRVGTTFVTKNSYLIKADIEKSGASHDH
jgi:membrane fusion protein, heavy metal efflux system